ncbi:hypothetical protein CRYUN_Cryun05aG0013000 [Craigia yunnanensis]
MYFSLLTNSSMKKKTWRNYGEKRWPVQVLSSHFFPRTVKIKLETWWDKLVYFLFPYVQITFHEYSSGLYNRSLAYTTIESYLCSKFIAEAARLEAVFVKKDQPLVLAMDDYEEVHDEFQGVKVNWYKGKDYTQTNLTYSRYRTPYLRRYYQLTFPGKHREIIIVKYLKHVMEEGKTLKLRRRLRRLYMKNPSEDYWDYAIFQHPSTFDTYAMDPRRKEVIINDLITFSQAKEYIMQRLVRFGSGAICFMVLQEQANPP